MALKINSQILSDLRTAIPAAFSRGMASAETYYQKFCSVIPSNSARNTYPKLSDWPTFRKWVGDRVFKDMSATAYSIENETFEASMDIKREDVEDDNLGVQAHIAETSGAAAKVLPDELVAELLKTGTSVNGFDGVPFFSDSHLGKQTGVDAGGNPVFETQSNIVGDVAEGLKAVLVCTRKPFKPFIVQPRRDFTLTAQFDPENPTVFNKNKFEFGSDGRVGVGFGPWMLAVGIFGEVTPAKYAQARAKMAGFTSDQGRKLGVTGDLLIVGTESEGAGLEILSADRTTGGKTNIWRGTAQLLVYPYL